MLDGFLLNNRTEILEATEQKTLELAADHPSSALLKEGLPTFYKQIIEIIKHAQNPSKPPPRNIEAIANAADNCDEPGMAEAAGQPGEAEVAKSAGIHGIELRRLGYTLSHVVHSYGAMCQAITETASRKKAAISASEFNILNRCLDAAIAGAVTEFQSYKTSEEVADSPDNEMRNALSSVIIAFESIKKGIVGIGGSTGQVLENNLRKMEKLIGRPRN